MVETVAFFQKGMLMVIWLSGPALLVAVVAGVLVSLLQTMLSIQDQALPFSFKLLAVGIMLAIGGRWMALELLGLGEQALQSVATMGFRGR